MAVLVTAGQSPIVLAVGADEDFFSFAHHTYFLETARYRLKYCLTELFNPKNNQPIALPPVKKNVILKLSSLRFSHSCLSAFVHPYVCFCPLRLKFKTKIDTKTYIINY